MSRFTRFVAASTLALFLLYLFYPSPPEVSLPQADTRAGSSKTISTKENVAPEPLRSVTPTSSKSYGVQSLRDKLAGEFPYDINSFFPGFIWQTWKTTPTDPDFQFREPEASWTEHHPEYIHEVVTDDIAARLVHHFYANIPEICEAYDILPKPILKADFFRYLILLARGGIYSDIDTQVIRPAWEWVPKDLALEKYGLVIGIEADPDRPDWAQWYSRRVQFCQWTMRSKPGHPALIEVIARLVEKTLAMKRANTLAKEGLESIVEWTGPAMWTDAIFDYMNSAQHGVSDSSTGVYSWKNLTGIIEAQLIRDVIVLPITGFSPGQGHMGSQDFTDEHAMVKHDFEGSWKPESERMISAD